MSTHSDNLYHLQILQLLIVHSSPTMKTYASPTDSEHSLQVPMALRSQEALYSFANSKRPSPDPRASHDEITDVYKKTLLSYGSSLDSQKLLGVRFSAFIGAYRGILQRS